MGYESIFGTLSRPTREGRRGSREFIFSDGTGGIERIRMDLSAHPHLLGRSTPPPSPTRPATGWPAPSSPPPQRHAADEPERESA